MSKERRASGVFTRDLVSWARVEYDSCQLRAPVSDAGGGLIEDTPELRVALQVFRTSGPRIGHWALAVSAYRCPLAYSTLTFTDFNFRRTHVLCAAQSLFSL